MNRTDLLAYVLLCWALPAVAQLPQPFAPRSCDRTRGAQPEVSELTISPDTVSELHLKPNYATTILMPEPVADVVLGSPTLFQEEHSEHAPELVVVKPITERAATSNLLISTRSGQHVSLRLVSNGETTVNSPVDFVLVYKRPRDFLIPSDDPADAVLSDASAKSKPVLEAAFEDQQRVASPAWTSPHDPKRSMNIAASIGSISADDNSMVVAFSVLNQSDQWVEVLPPQIELNNPASQPDSSKAKKKQKNILADQVPIIEYRYTQRKTGTRGACGRRGPIRAP